MWQLPDTLDYAICGSYLPLYALYYVTSNRHVSFAVVCTMWQLPDTLYHALLYDVCDSYQTLYTMHYVTATRHFLPFTMWQLPDSICSALCDSYHTLYAMHYVTTYTHYMPCTMWHDCRAFWWQERKWIPSVGSRILSYKLFTFSSHHSYHTLSLSLPPHSLSLSPFFTLSSPLSPPTLSLFLSPSPKWYCC